MNEMENKKAYHIGIITDEEYCNYLYDRITHNELSESDLLTKVLSYFGDVSDEGYEEEILGHIFYEDDEYIISYDNFCGYFDFWKK